MTSVDELRQIKMLLVGLAEYLQTTLSDAQIRLYSEALTDVGARGLATAIERLQADPDVWPGKFPLPGKIRSYLTGAIDDMAVESATRILALETIKDAYAKLSPIELQVAKSYGLDSIINRPVGSGPTIFAQLRDALRATAKSKGTQLELPRDKEKDRLQDKSAKPGPLSLGESLRDSLRQREGTPPEGKD